MSRSCGVAMNARPAFWEAVSVRSEWVDVTTRAGTGAGGFCIGQRPSGQHGIFLVQLRGGAAGLASPARHVGVSAGPHAEISGQFPGRIVNYAFRWQIGRTHGLKPAALRFAFSRFLLEQSYSRGGGSAPGGVGVGLPHVWRAGFVQLPRRRHDSRAGSSRRLRPGRDARKSPSRPGA